MTVLVQLWIPILLASIIVFVASAVIHMLTPWHAGDHRQMPDQDKARAAISPLRIPPGDYVLPRPDNMRAMNSPEFRAQLEEGPRMIATVLPNGSTNMAKMLVSWFIYIAVISYFSGYMVRCTLGREASYLSVFHVAAVAAFLGYSGAVCQMSIWFGRSWVTTVKSIIDGLIYALLTAGTFGWLWPR